MFLNLIFPYRYALIPDKMLFSWMLFWIAYSTHVWNVQLCLYFTLDVFLVDIIGNIPSSRRWLSSHRPSAVGVELISVKIFEIQHYLSTYIIKNSSCQEIVNIILTCSHSFFKTLSRAVINVTMVCKLIQQHYNIFLLGRFKQRRSRYREALPTLTTILPLFSLTRHWDIIFSYIYKQDYANLTFIYISHKGILSVPCSI